MRNIADVLLGDALGRGQHDEPALLCDGAPMSYGELDALSGRFASALTTAGAGRQARVLLALEDTPELVACFLGALKAGAVAVPINPRLRPDALAHVLADAKPALVVAEPECALDGASTARVVWRGTPPGGPEGGGVSLDAFVAGHAPIARPVEVAATDMAYWLYTSGTTGEPKGVVHGHRDIEVADRHLGENLGVGRGSRVLATSKLFFAYALGHCVLGALKCGATAVLHPRWPTPQAVAALVAATRPDVVLSVPTLYRNLLGEGMAGQPAFAAVRHFVCAGEPLPPRIYRDWLTATGRPILQGIGTSETTFLVVANTPAAHGPGTLGRPLAYAEVQLRDEAGARIEAPGQPGLLWVRLPSLMRGYWRQPERTAAVMDDRGFYCTGDILDFDAAGDWRYHGRRDEMLKVSGQWVSPAEIEQAVAGVPGLRDAAGVATRDADGFPLLALFVVCTDGDEGEVLRRVEQTLEEALLPFKRPRIVRCVDAIPRTPTGKPQRYRLAAALG